MAPKIELKPDQTILFTGDSITDCERLMPGLGPFGNGYVNFTANLLLAKFPQLNLRIINTGIGGDTSRDLAARWRKACLKHKPDILSILIGINDLWRQHEGPQNLSYAVYPYEYESNCRQILQQVKQRCDCRLILLEPFMFCDNPENQMFIGLKAYLDIVHQLAEDFGAILVPLQDRINTIIGQVRPAKWSDDMVHPYTWAHAWICRQWFEAVGL